MRTTSAKGENHYNWKGGKPKCPTCGKILLNYTSLACVKHKRISLEGRVKKRGQIAWNRGKPWSEEMKLKMSQAHIGASAWNKGKKAGQLGIRYGEQINTWKGGINPINHTIRNSPEYKAWRILVFQRDNFTCVLCGDKKGTKNADHIKQFAYYPELRFSIDNGRTLCVPCHKKTDTYGHRI